MKKKNTLRLFWWPTVIFSAVIAYVVTMLFSIGQSVWFDEGYSILLAKSSWSELFALTAVDAHPPFYYVLLKIWGSIFGFDEFALRSLSALLLSSSIVAVAVLLRKLFTPKVALLTLPIILLAPFLLRYGYEVRMYSMAMLIGITATYALVVALQGKQWWRWAIYAALVALGMYTLYMTVVVWLAHATWLLVQSLSKRPRQKILEWSWLYAYIGAIALFLPYIPTFLHQIIHSALPGIGSEITLTRLVDITTVLFTFTPEWKVGGWLSVLIIAGIALTIWLGIKTYKHLSKDEKRYYGFLAFLVVVPLSFYALTSLPPRDPIFVNRYLAHIAVFIYAFVGVTLAFGVVYRRKLKSAKHLPFVTYGIVVVLFSIGLVALQTAGNYIFERNQTPHTLQIRDSIQCSDAVTIIADDPYTYIDTVFYYDDCDLRFFSAKDVEKRGGYAPLHESAFRVGDASEVMTPIIIRLGWQGAEAQFKPDARYTLVDSIVYDRQLVETYRLIVE